MMVLRKFAHPFTFLGSLGELGAVLDDWGSPVFVNACISFALLNLRVQVTT